MNSNEKFSEEEKKYLSYLGAALSRSNDEHEDLFEKMLEPEEKGQLQPAKRQKRGGEQTRYCPWEC